MSEARQRKLGSGAIVFAFNAIAGIGIWLTSLGITGHREPWDAEGFFYAGAMFFAGLISGALAPRGLWLSWAGMYVGQFLGMLFVNPHLGPLTPLGLFLFLPVYCLTTLAGAALAAVVRAAVCAVANRKIISDNP
jgi:hypothetical protein